MNGVFAEECGGLLPGQRAGVSQQPADLSTAAVFMLRLVPQLSLPVVLPVFLFPNSSSHSPWSPPPPSSSSHFSMQPSHSSRTWYLQHTCHRVNFLALSLLKYSKICHVGRPLEPENMMYSAHIHTWEHFWGYICIHCCSLSTAALALCHINWACMLQSI